MKKILITILLCAVLTGCGDISSVSQNTENTEKTVSQNIVNIEKSVNENKVNIEKTNAELLEEHLVDYNHEDIFSVTAPGTWEVSTGSYDMFYWIHLYDPNNENLQVFTLIEATSILKNQNAKETIEAFDIDDIYTPVALDNKLLHASFDNPLTMEKGEGLFTAAVTEGLVMTDPGFDCGYYNVYNITGISAPYGMLNEYEDILRRIVGSIQYSDAFIDTCSQNQGNILKSASYVNQIMQDTSNIITEGWNARQKSYDVISQKYSDATLGYERVRDINDPEKIYRAYNGFMDSEFSEGFELVNDDDYSKEVSGYINK